MDANINPVPILPTHKVFMVNRFWEGTGDIREAIEAKFGIGIGQIEYKSINGKGLIKKKRYSRKGGGNSEILAGP